MPPTTPPGCRALWPDSGAQGLEPSPVSPDTACTVPPPRRTRPDMGYTDVHEQALDPQMQGRTPSPQQRKVMSRVAASPSSAPHVVCPIDIASSKRTPASACLPRGNSRSYPRTMRNAPTSDLKHQGHVSSTTPLVLRHCQSNRPTPSRPCTHVTALISLSLIHIS